MGVKFVLSYETPTCVTREDEEGETGVLGLPTSLNCILFSVVMAPPPQETVKNKCIIGDLLKRKWSSNYNNKL
jgi:hypothetical protein